MNFTISTKDRALLDQEHAGVLESVAAFLVMAEAAHREAKGDRAVAAAVVANLMHQAQPAVPVGLLNVLAVTLVHAVQQQIIINERNGEHDRTMG